MKRAELQNVIKVYVRPKKVFFGSFSLRKGGNEVCGGAANELHKIAISCMATTETDIEIEVLVVLRRVKA